MSDIKNLMNKKNQTEFDGYLESRTAFMQQVYNSREIIRDVQDGMETEAVKMKYIKQLEKEPDETYKNRLSYSIFYNTPNWFAKTNYNRPFGVPAMIDSDDETIKALQDNFDGFKNTLTEVGRRAFKKAIYDSQVHFFVDLEKNPSKKFNPDLNVKVNVLDNDKILGVEVDEETGEIIHFRFASGVKMPHQDNPFDTVLAKVIYVFDKRDGKVFFNKWVRVNDEDEYEPLYGYGKTEDGKTVYTTQPYHLDVIPVISYYPEEVEIPFYPNLILKDLCNKSIEYFRSASDQTNILHVARVPILMLWGMPESAGGVAIGSSVALVADENAENAGGKFIEINGQSISAGRLHEKDLLDQMQSLGLELMNKKASTATEAQISNEQSLSILNSYAMKFEDTLKQVTDLIILQKQKAGKQFTTTEYTLQIDTKFSVVVNQEELQFMQYLRSSGDISGKSITDYAKKLGYLPSNYNYEEDLEENLSIGIPSTDILPVNINDNSNNQG